MLLPDSIISISDKWHGTSVVIGNLLAKRELPWYERLAKSFGVKVQESEYAIVTSSRKVIKSVNGQARDTDQHYYTSDVWSYWSDRIKGGIPAGYTVYGEIVGYTATGEPVQKGYAYGCTPHVGAASSNSRLLVYRVTFTNADGSVFELPWLQMCGWCLVRGIETVPTLYWGRAGVSAGDLVPHLDGEDLRDWRDSFLQYLENAYVNDGDCPHNPGMPAEGIVVRIDHADGTCTALKLKNYRFLEHETKLLDAGEDNLEDSESAGDVVESDTI